MKRVITSFRRANKDVLRAISLEYPKGVDDTDFTSFPTPTGKNIRALEIKYEDCLYLVKLESQEYYKQFIAKEKTEDDDVEDEKSEESDEDIVEPGLETLDEESED